MTRIWGCFACGRWESLFDCSHAVDLVSRFSDSMRRMLENSKPRNLKFFVKDIYKNFFLSLEDT